MHNTEYQGIIFYNGEKLENVDVQRDLGVLVHMSVSSEVDAARINNANGIKRFE